LLIPLVLGSSAAYAAGDVTGIPGFCTSQLLGRLHALAVHFRRPCSWSSAWSRRSGGGIRTRSGHRSIASPCTSRSGRA